jgi:hypothetical protein
MGTPGSNGDRHHVLLQPSPVIIPLALTPALGLVIGGAIPPVCPKSET